MPLNLVWTHRLAAEIALWSCSNWSCPESSGQLFFMLMRPTSSTTCHPCFGRSALADQCIEDLWCACLMQRFSLRCVPACLYVHAYLPAHLHECLPAYLPACLPGSSCDLGAEAVSNSSCLQGAQLEPQLGSSKFLLVVFELLVSSHVIMVSDHSLSAYLQNSLLLSIAHLSSDINRHAHKFTTLIP